jgi:hypothetical protein
MPKTLSIEEVGMHPAPGTPGFASFARRSGRGDCGFEGEHNVLFENTRTR